MGSSSDLKDLLRERIAAKYTIDDLKDTGKKIRKTAPIVWLPSVRLIGTPSSSLIVSNKT